MGVRCRSRSLFSSSTLDHLRFLLVVSDPVWLPRVSARTTQSTMSSIMALLCAASSSRLCGLMVVSGGSSWSLDSTELGVSALTAFPASNSVCLSRDGACAACPLTNLFTLKTAFLTSTSSTLPLFHNSLDPLLGPISLSLSRKFTLTKFSALLLSFLVNTDNSSKARRRLSGHCDGSG